MERNEPRDRDPDRCPSVNAIGKRCQGQAGHRGMHQAEQGAVRWVWSDASSPASAIDLVER